MQIKDQQINKLIILNFISYPKCLICLCALRTHMPYLSAFVPLPFTRILLIACLTCYHLLCVLSLFFYLRALRTFLFLRALRAFLILRALHAFISYMPYVSTIFKCLAYLDFFHVLQLHSYFTCLHFLKCLLFINVLSLFLYALIFFTCLDVFSQRVQGSLLDKCNMLF